MNWILLNTPLAILMVAFTVGLPAWVILKFPEGGDGGTGQLAEVRTGPAGRNIYELAATAAHSSSVVG